MRTIANCLAEIGVSIEMLTACHDLHEEWAVLKKSYFKAALATHPDKGGDTAKFRKVQASFESLRALFDSGAVTSYATSASKSIDNAAPSHASVPSWDFYANAAEEPVPIYRVEPAKSGRSKCSAKGKAKTCGADELIPVGHLRVGSLDADTGSYGRWVRLECWRVPSKVWLGLADPDKCADATLFTAALLSMSSVLLSGVGELSEEHASAFTDHCMRKSAWAALVKRKGMPPPAQAAAASAAPAGAPTSSGASASNALAEASASASSALVAGLPGEKQRFVIPLPGKDAPANTLAGKTVVITGIFPEVGGGAGLDLGKARVKAMVEAFGGKVTSSVSGRTDVLIVGKEPGGSKVGKARSVGCTLMSLHDVRKGLVVGNLAAISDGQAPMAITSFSTGYRGNGIGHAIKAPPPPPKPAPPVARKPKAPPPPPKAPAPPAARKPKQSSAKVASAAVMEDETKEEPPASRKASASKARPAMKNAEGKGAQKATVAKKRKATADLWLAVEPIAAPKKLRPPPRARTRS